MSLLEEVHFHPNQKYCDFEDEKHSMAVFGLGASVLRHEVEVEIEQAMSVDSDDSDK